MTNDFVIHYLPPNTPVELGGFVVKDSEDFFTILLNPNLSYDAQRLTVAHEMVHIDENHFYSDKSLSEKEQEAENRRFKMLNLLDG